MKITNKVNQVKQQAFTLIEMIGVLAVIAILAALLIPKIFEAINNARINNAALSCNTVKTATADHYAKFGTLLTSNGTPFTVASPFAQDFDHILLSEGFLDKPFAVRISGSPESNYVHIVTAVANTVAPATGNVAYNLDGAGDANDAVGTSVVEAVIDAVTEADAKDLNDRLDGPALGSAIGAADMLGRVKYPASAAGALVQVQVYLTHR